MKKMQIALCALMILIAVADARAENQSYTFGVYWDTGTKFNTSFSVMAKDMTKEFSQTQNIQMFNLFYNNIESFQGDIGTRKLDFIYANSEDDFLLATIYGYKPLATISIFDKEKASECLYVKKDSAINGVADLAGKKLSTYPYQTAYTLLRKIMNAAPEKTLSEMLTSTDAYASVDALASGKVDAIFLMETNIDYFELMNPAPVKNIRKLACAEPLHFMPLMASPNISEELMKKMEAFSVSLNNNEVLDKYKPLMKQVKFKVIPVSETDYKPFFDLYDFTLAEGWDKDFDTWVASAKPLK